MIASRAFALCLLVGVVCGRADDAPAPETKRAPDLVAPAPELAATLARFDAEAEPGRELKRAFVSVVQYLLVGDVDKTVVYFHPDLRFHVGNGDLEPMPPARLRAMLAEQKAEVEAAGERRPALAETLDIASVRAYSRARARELDGLAEGFEVEPAKIADLMQDDDWLVIGRLKGGEWGTELFYVFRRDGERWKVVLAE
jgi:hypothetical protein